MPTAEIIAIGTELLLGEIQDTNTRYLARQLRDAGIDLYRTTIIGDNEHRIAQAIQEAMHRSDIILTTGGLGPTVDDPTRQAVARAVGVEVEYRPELWDQIQERFSRYGRRATENNRRQAYIPAGAAAIENPVGTAPGFIVDTSLNVIISLPGVPREMEYLFQSPVLPYLKERFQLQSIIQAYVIHTAGVGESQVDEWVSDLETNANPTVGLLAHPGQVDIRVTAKGSSREETEQMISAVVAEILERVGDAYFGANDETLESVVLPVLQKQPWALVESGFDGILIQLLKPTYSAAQEDGSSDQTLRAARELREFYQAELALSAHLERTGRQHRLTLALVTLERTYEAERTYGGPPENSILWAANTTMDFIRRSMRERVTKERG
ncbi:MAG TPA: CinA family nicotinamide mononucleotide deamidase-related protein [Chloroflexi bacterium]|nr:CinA family nicotinamide mononucleotide deamidase-related protein [Chloroflexota bacterium]